MKFCVDDIYYLHNLRKTTTTKTKTITTKTTTKKTKKTTTTKMTRTKIFIIIKKKLYHTKPSLLLRRVYTDFLSCKMLGKNLHYSVSPSSHLQTSSGKNLSQDAFSDTTPKNRRDSLKEEGMT